MNNFMKTLLFIIFISTAIAQEKISWIKTSEALEKTVSSEKTILLYVRTEWCVFCRKLNKDVFENEEIIKYVNSNFIPAKIDADSKFDVVKYDGKSYSAKEYTRIVGVKTYPTILFINKDGKPIASLVGYYPKDDVLEALKFVIKGKK